MAWLGYEATQLHVRSRGHGARTPRANGSMAPNYAQQRLHLHGNR